MTDEEFMAMIKDIPKLLCAGTHDAKQVHVVAHGKRLAELFIADPNFREAYEKNPQAALTQFGIDLSPGDAAAVLNIGSCISEQKADMVSPALRTHFSYFYEKMNFRLECQNSRCVPTEPKFKKWRQRQLNRCWGEFGGANTAFIHVPIIFELSKGCSMECDFCALAAAKLEGVFRATPENLTLWREVLLKARQVIGEAAGSGVCYCASEPFDNADYEQFSQIYEEVFGVVPQVTTAAAMRNPHRTKSFLAKVNHNPTIHRFSVLSLDLHREILEYFTPEELLYVELLPRFPEASAYNGIVKAGRAREDNDNIAQSISCASGFVVNMVERSIRITTPCNADTLHPTGEMKVGEARFQDGEDFAIRLQKMIQTYMKTSFDKEKMVAFPDYFTVHQAERGFTLESRAKLKVSFNNTKDKQIDVYGQVGKLIQEGCWTAREIAGKLWDAEKVEPAEVFYCIDYLYKAGCLREE